MRAKPWGHVPRVTVAFQGSDSNQDQTLLGSLPRKYADSGTQNRAQGLCIMQKFLTTMAYSALSSSSDLTPSTDLAHSTSNCPLHLSRVSAGRLLEDDWTVWDFSSGLTPDGLNLPVLLGGNKTEEAEPRWRARTWASGLGDYTLPLTPFSKALSVSLLPGCLTVSSSHLAPPSTRSCLTSGPQQEANPRRGLA